MKITNTCRWGGVVQFIAGADGTVTGLNALGCDYDQVGEDGATMSTTPPLVVSVWNTADQKAMQALYTKMCADLGAEPEPSVVVAPTRSPI